MATVYDEDEINKYLGLSQPMMVNDPLLNQYTRDVAEPFIYLPSGDDLPTATGKSKNWDSVDKALNTPMDAQLYKPKGNPDDWTFFEKQNTPQLADKVKEADVYGTRAQKGTGGTYPNSPGMDLATQSGLDGGVEGGTGSAPFSAEGNISSMNSQGNTRNPLAEAAGRRMGKMGTTDGDPNASQQGRKDYMQPPAQLPQLARTPMPQSKEGTQAGDPNAIQMGDQAPVISEEEQPQAGMERPQAAIWPDWLKREQGQPEETGVATSFSNMFPSIDPSSGAGAALLGLISGIDETGARSAAAFGDWSPDSGVALARQPLTTAANINAVNKDRYTQKLDIAKLDATARAAELKAQGKGPASGRPTKVVLTNPETAMPEEWFFYPDGTRILLGLAGSAASLANTERLKQYELEATQRKDLKESSKLRVPYGKSGQFVVTDSTDNANRLKEANIALDQTRNDASSIKKLIFKDMTENNGKLSSKTMKSLTSTLVSFIGNLSAFRKLGVLQAGDIQFLGKELGITDANIDAAITDPIKLAQQIVNRAEVSDNPGNTIKELDNFLKRMDQKHKGMFNQYGLEADSYSSDLQGNIIPGASITTGPVDLEPVSPTTYDNTGVYTELANSTGLLVDTVVEIAKVLPRKNGETGESYGTRLKEYIIRMFGGGGQPSSEKPRPVFTLPPAKGSKAAARPQPKPTASPAPKAGPTDWKDWKTKKGVK